MEEYLEAIRPFLPANLVSTEVFDHIVRLARVLPPTGAAGFECRLRDDEPRVDFHLFLPPVEVDWPEPLLARPAGLGLQDFCRQWARPGSLPATTVKNAILEFDVTGLTEVPTPSVFLALKREAFRDAEVLLELAGAHLGAPRSSPAAAGLRRALDLLPPDGGVSHLGAMIGRGAAALRVNAGGFRPEEVPPYLAQLGWRGSGERLLERLSTFAPLTDGIDVSFDLAEAAPAKIGLECFLRRQPHEEPRWEALLSLLVERGLCAEGKRAAALGWPGVMRKDSSPATWPGTLGWGDLFLDHAALSLLLRRLSHVKIVHGPDGTDQAKLYLLFAHQWLDRAAIGRPPGAGMGGLTASVAP
jgi:hypothetical protein